MDHLNGIVGVFGQIAPWLFLILLVAVMLFRIVLAHLPDTRTTADEPVRFTVRFLKKFVEYAGNVTVPAPPFQRIRRGAPAARR